MIKSQYSLTSQPSPDDAVYEAAAGFPGEPIRFRIQPQLFMRVEGRHRAGMYRGWRGVYWNVSCRTPEDAIAVRDVLAQTFVLLGRVPVEEVQALLQQAIDSVVESRGSDALSISDAVGPLSR